jgi:signal transduction histidine kinase
MDGIVRFQSSCSSYNATEKQVGVDAIGLLRVDVKDSGVGIEHEDQSRVFGEFTQFDRNTLQGGGRFFRLLIRCILRESVSSS